MTTAGLVFATRQGNIQVGADFVNGKGFTDDVYLSESIKHFFQPRRFNSIDFNVPILRLPAHQLVAHTPADE